MLNFEGEKKVHFSLNNENSIRSQKLKWVGVCFLKKKKINLDIHSCFLFVLFGPLSNLATE